MLARPNHQVMDEVMQLQTKGAVPFRPGLFRNLDLPPKDRGMVVKFLHLALLHLEIRTVPAFHQLLLPQKERGTDMKFLPQIPKQVVQAVQFLRQDPWIIGTCINHFLGQRAGSMTLPIFLT